MASLKRSFDDIDQTSTLDYDHHQFQQSSQDSSLSPPGASYLADHNHHDWGLAWNEVIGIPRVDAGELVDENETFSEGFVFPALSNVHDGFQSWPENGLGAFSNYGLDEPASQPTSNTEHPRAGFDICFGMVS